VAKKTIGVLYLLGLGLTILLPVAIFLTPGEAYNETLKDVSFDQDLISIDQANHPSEVPTDQAALAADQQKLDAARGDLIRDSLLGAIPGQVLIVIGWIGALVNVARAREWTWFVLLFFLSGIMIIIYWIAGPQPGEERVLPPVRAGLGSGGSAPYPGARAGASPEPDAAMAILRQRYARGEIDTATYDAMRARLERRDPPPRSSQG
jgi:Short C-terminal domain